MKKLFWTACLSSAFVFISPVDVTFGEMPPAAAYAQSDSEMSVMMDELRTVGAWSNEVNAIMIDIASLFSSETFMTLLGEMEDASPGNFDAADKALAAWQSDTAMRMTDIGAKLDALPPPPVFKSKALKELTEAVKPQYDNVKQTYDGVGDLIDQIETLFLQTKSGDSQGTVELTRILFQSSIDLLDAENNMMQSSIDALPDQNHPNVFLIGMMIEINNLGIHSLQIDMLGLDDQQSLGDRSSVLKEMKASIRKGEQLEKKGRKATKSSLRQMKAYALLAKTEQEKSLFGTVVSMFENFEGAIDVEAQHLSFMKQIYELYSEDKSIDDLTDAVIDVDNETYPLVDKRLELQAQRTQAAANLQ
jgi:hypothetical protein